MMNENWWTYEECMSHTLVWVKKYATARKEGDEYDKWFFQDVRDELSEALVFFGPHYADLRANAEQAEVDRKNKIEERKEYWRDHYKRQRGTASMVESKAIQDCKVKFDHEVEAKREYYRARIMIERVDQVLNSIASRLKLLEKYDKEG